MSDEGRNGAGAGEAARPPGWTGVDEALWGLCCELREVRAACAALLERWDAGEDLAWTVQRELLGEALELDRLARRLAREFHVDEGVDDGSIQKRSASAAVQ